MKGTELAALPENATSTILQARERAEASIADAKNQQMLLAKAIRKAKECATQYNNLVLEYQGQLTLFESDT